MAIGNLGRPGRLGLTRGTGVRSRTTPLRVATFGDSTADYTSMSTTDVSAWSASFGAGTTQTLKYATKLLASSLYPQFFAVGNGGIGGQTTTAMLARSGLGASANRRSIEDIIALSPHVVLLRGGSINDLLGFTPPITQANIDAVAARHQQIAVAFTAAGVPVIDCGVYGYSGATNTAAVRSALVSLNAKLATLAVGRWYFIDPSGITHDGTGAYLPNISGDGTHLSVEGQRLIGAREAAILGQLFGRAIGPRYSGENVIPNAELSASGAQSYGVQGTGWAINATNATRSNAKIETISGVKFQTCEFTPTADASSCQISIPFGIIGASPAITIAAGLVYGFEVDLLVQSVSGGAPPVGNVLARIDISKGTPRNIYNPIEGWTAQTLGAAIELHAIYEPIVIPDFGGSQNNLTAATWQLVFQVSTPGDRTPFKLGVGNPRMVRLS